jgi:toxin ParE1/3/4
VAPREGVRRYSLEPAAENDLALIFDYIAEKNPDAADRLMDALIGAFDRLADHPKLGHRRTDLTDLAVRFWSVRDNLIVYRGERDVEILRVLHGRRDVAAELAQKRPPPSSVRR